MQRTGQVKIGVIGAGAVGSACVLSSILRGIAREIVLVNRDRKRAKAVVTDLQYGAALSSLVQIRDGDYSDLTGAALVMITAGMNEKAGGATNRNDPAGRLKLLESNVGIYRQILPEILRTVPEAVILVVTDPPDPLADFVRTFGFTRVLSTGTFLDSLPSMSAKRTAAFAFSALARQRCLGRRVLELAGTISGTMSARPAIARCGRGRAERGL